MYSAIELRKTLPATSFLPPVLDHFLGNLDSPIYYQIERPASTPCWQFTVEYAGWALALSAMLLSRMMKGKAGPQALFHPI